MEAEASKSTASAKTGATESEGDFKEEMTTIESKGATYNLTEVNAEHDGPVDERDADGKSFGQGRTPKHANKTGGSRDDSSPSSPGKNLGFDREGTDMSNQKITPDRSDPSTMPRSSMRVSHANASYPTQDKMPYSHGHREAPPQGYYAPPAGQYRPQQQQQQLYGPRMPQPQAQPQAVSPGATNMGGYHSAGYSGQGSGYQQGRYENQGYSQGEYGGGGRYDQRAYRTYYAQGGFPSYHRGAYAQDSRHAYGDGSMNPQYGNRLPPAYYQQRQTPVAPEHDPRYADQYGNVSGVTRAVSSSFDRSTKSTENAAARTGEPPRVVPGEGVRVDPSPSMKPVYYSQAATRNVPPIHERSGSVGSDDDSWRQLKQVASVDDQQMRARYVAEKSDDDSKTSPKEKRGGHPPSNSSSLTNSPAEGTDDAGKGKSDSAPSNLAPLDSLSSVASEQEPIKDGKPTKEAAINGPPSPGSSSASLDLMKCHSGSSGLLHEFPPHGRSLSNTSFHLPQADLRLDSKRSREDREDGNTMARGAGEGVRRIPSGLEAPPSKKMKGEHGDKDHSMAKADSKASPLPIECSPPDSPPDKRNVAEHSKPQASRTVDRRGSFAEPPGYSAYYDKAPLYSYSLESAPSREYGGRGYPPLPPRPGSSSSSTITPGASMQIDGPVASREGVGTLPSWDLNIQDSFGGGSTLGGGGHITSSFSFTQEYPSLSASGSNLGYSVPQPPVVARGAPQPSRQHGPSTSLPESRNQSFEGGVYHGSFGRSESMDAGPPGGPRYQYQDGYNHTGQFPPHAPSWGTASTSNSAPTQHQGSGYYNQYRGGGPARMYPPSAMARNYSEDSAARTSPPTAPAFQPPPEFSAPHNPHLAKRPPPAVYIMSTSASDDPSMFSKSDAGGVYSWTDDEDARLTEIMKKYKNPRDWDPIAKEHNRGKR